MIIVDDEIIFDGGEWQRVTDEHNEAVWLSYDGFWLDAIEGVIRQDSAGNRYMVEHYYDDGQFTDCAYTYEPISVLKDQYLFTPTEGVDFDSLEDVCEMTPIPGEFNFILSGEEGVFVYNGRQTSGSYSAFLYKHHPELCQDLFFFARDLHLCGREQIGGF